MFYIIIMVSGKNIQLNLWVVCNAIGMTMETINYNNNDNAKYIRHSHEYSQFNATALMSWEELLIANK